MRQASKRIPESAEKTAAAPHSSLAFMFCAGPLTVGRPIPAGYSWMRFPRWGF